MDEARLIKYFKGKVGKYLVIKRCKKICLERMIVNNHIIYLKFSYNNYETELRLDISTNEYIVMTIPEGLWFTDLIKLGNLKDIGDMLERLLTNWIGQKEEALGLLWIE